MEATITNRLEQDFEQFHRDNPGVWEMFQRFTFQLISFGYRHHSADAVMHRVRWESSTQTTTADEFKINNNHVAFYARMFHREYPIFRTFFRIRKQSHKDVINGPRKAQGGFRNDGNLCNEHSGIE